MKRRYKLSLADLVKWLIKQKWRCAICRVPITFADAVNPDPQATKGVVDHDHGDGHVRGLLCSACNVAIGLLEDNLIYIARAYKYLKRDQFSSPRISTSATFEE